jgi:hypothetical protein
VRLDGEDIEEDRPLARELAVRYRYPGTIVNDLSVLVARWPAALAAVMVSV